MVPMSSHRPLSEPSPVGSQHLEQRLCFWVPAAGGQAVSWVHGDGKKRAIKLLCVFNSSRFPLPVFISEAC